MKLLTVIGARPQIIKAAAFSRAVAQWNESHDIQVQEVILHTGQHYDDNMSAVFFRELGIPEPDINLHVGSGSHGAQTARMIEGIEEVLVNGEKESGEKFDGVVLYGDTNSTLAGAVAAAKIHVPVFHIEAGLRSWNMAMPEEINRIVCDQLSSVLFTPTKTGMNNLLKAGFRMSGLEDERMSGERVHFRNGKGQYVVLSGDVMYDNSMYFASMAETKSDIIERLHLTPKRFILATIHRPANTDSATNLTSIFRALLTIATEHDMQVVLPLHPRTRKLLPNQLPAELLQQVEQCPNIIITEPASFFDIIRLEKHAQVVMTDSGGVQKEAFFFSTPCVILRPETEWIEIVEAGAGILADADYDRILAAYRQLANHPVHFPPLFGDAHAAEQILTEIVEYLSRSATKS
ncbi:MAG: UDP-N-acetylglucosamine 2-epimerase (non-hydrolyzing) [Bacteroidales bacterium]|nr:UDP-N-acetylglucosamine 2-epimerase (non-hydrolyzing) [Candidatus Colicola equi]